jgi:hypothetical protein
VPSSILPKWKSASSDQPARLENKLQELSQDIPGAHQGNDSAAGVREFNGSQPLPVCLVLDGPSQTSAV